MFTLYTSLLFVTYIFFKKIYISFIRITFLQFAWRILTIATLRLEKQHQKFLVLHYPANICPIKSDPPSPLSSSLISYCDYMTVTGPPSRLFSFKLTRVVPYIYIWYFLLVILVRQVCHYFSIHVFLTKSELYHCIRALQKDLLSPFLTSTSPKNPYSI